MIDTHPSHISVTRLTLPLLRELPKGAFLLEYGMGRKDSPVVVTFAGLGPDPFWSRIYGYEHDRVLVTDSQKRTVGYHFADIGAEPYTTIGWRRYNWLELCHTQPPYIAQQLTPKLKGLLLMAQAKGERQQFVAVTEREKVIGRIARKVGRLIK